MCSLLSSKSEFCRSTVSHAGDATFENVTVHDGPLLAVLEHTIIVLCCSESFDTEPFPGEYFPLGHAAQAIDPSVAAYVPIAHSPQASLELAPSIAEYLPAAHASQVLMNVAPTRLENLPIGQRSQKVLAGCDPNFPGSQSWQDESVSLPTVVEYLPIWHESH